MGVPQNHPSKWMILGVPAAGTRWRRDWAPDTTATQMQERTALFTPMGTAPRSACRKAERFYGKKGVPPEPVYNAVKGQQ